MVMVVKWSACVLTIRVRIPLKSTVWIWKLFESNGKRWLTFEIKAQGYQSDRRRVLFLENVLKVLFFQSNLCVENDRGTDLKMNWTLRLTSVRRDHENWLTCCRFDFWKSSSHQQYQKFAQNLEALDKVLETLRSFQNVRKFYLPGGSV